MNIKSRRINSSYLYKREKVADNKESKLMREIAPIERLMEKISNGEETVTSLHQGLSILSKVSDLKNIVGDAIAIKLYQLVDMHIQNTNIQELEAEVLQLQTIYNKLLADEISLCSLVLGPEVRVQTPNELKLWESDRHRGVCTRNEAIGALEGGGDWLIFYSTDNQSHIFLQKLKDKIIEVNLHPNTHFNFVQVQRLADLNKC